MRRKYLLSAAMLSLMLATSACGAESPAPVASSQPAHLTGSGTGDASISRPEVGISQWNAAEAARKAKTKAAVATKEEPAAKTKPAAAKPGATAETEPAGAAKAKAAEKAAAAQEAAAEKAAAAAAEKKAAAKEKAAGTAAKTPPATGGLKQVTPVPAAPKTSPAPAGQGPADDIGDAACEAAHTLDDALQGSVTVTDPALPIGVGIGTDAGTTGEFRCPD